VVDQGPDIEVRAASETSVAYVLESPVSQRAVHEAEELPDTELAPASEDDPISVQVGDSIPASDEDARIAHQGSRTAGTTTQRELWKTS